jgi:hypothetical protein
MKEHGHATQNKPESKPEAQKKKTNPFLKFFTYVKLLAYRIFNPAKAEPEPEAKAEPKSEAKAEPPSDLTPQIAKRAYELYEQRGRQDGRAVQDWEQAEREIRKDEPHK